MIFPRRGSDRLPDSVVLVIWLLAASLGAVLAKDTAFVEVVLFESSPNGDYTTYTTGLQGRFSKAGATISAEGEIVQVRVKVCLLQGYQQTRATAESGCSFTKLPSIELSELTRYGVCVCVCEDGMVLKPASICGHKMAPILWNSFTGKTCSCKLILLDNRSKLVRTFHSSCSEIEAEVFFFWVTNRRPLQQVCKLSPSRVIWCVCVRVSQ